MIGAIIVLYNPEWDLFKRGLKGLVSQVDEVCIVDNSPIDNSSRLEENIKIKYIPLLHNNGIAAAQNIGIKYFIDRNYDYVIFSDQDSVAPNNIIKELLDAHRKLKKRYKIAAIGPMPINSATNIPYFIKENCIEQFEHDGYNYCRMFSIISSYSLVELEVFKTIGMMDESLFIDFVDSEWCWRADYYYQHHSFLVSSVKISHELGRYKSLYGKMISISTPFRLYYQIRNLLWLYKKSYVPKYWIKRCLKKMILKLVYYPIFVSPRIKYIKSIIKGVKDGVLRV